MLKGLPTFLIVTTVALAIWIVAEAESVRTETFSPIVAIDPSGYEGHMARPDPARRWPSRVTITAEGSTASLDALRGTFEQGVTLAPGRGLREEPGVYTEDLRRAISELLADTSPGVTISAVDPPTVGVEIAEQDSFELPVELLRDRLNIEGDPEIHPPRVTITGPKAYIDLLQAGQSRARVRLRDEDLRRLIPGQRETIAAVRVELPVEIPPEQFWGSAPITPGVVEVVLTLRAQSRTYVIPSVGVMLAVAPVDYNDWDVLIDENNRFLSDVTITGPSDIIAQFERGEKRVDAFVRLNFQDLTSGVTAGTITREAQFGPLPAGVTAQCEDMSIQLQVRSRQEATPETPPSANNN